MRVTVLVVALASVLACGGGAAVGPAPSPLPASPTTSASTLASAGPGEEIGLFLELHSGYQAGHGFRWPTTRFVPCRALARAAKPPQSGYVELKLVIGESGVVASVETLGSDGLDEKVVACVIE